MKPIKDYSGWLAESEDTDWDDLLKNVPDVDLDRLEDDDDDQLASSLGIDRLTGVKLTEKSFWKVIDAIRDRMTSFDWSLIDIEQGYASEHSDWLSIFIYKRGKKWRKFEFYIRTDASEVIENNLYGLTIDGYKESTRTTTLLDNVLKWKGDYPTDAFGLYKMLSSFMLQSDEELESDDQWEQVSLH